MSNTLPIRILFNTWANDDNVGSQSLTAREIAVRLDQNRCRCSFFIVSGQSVDSRLRRSPHVQLITLPPRMGTVVMARELLWGNYDILFYPSLNLRASRIYWGLKGISRNKLVIENVECSLDQIHAFESKMRNITFHSIRNADCCFAITPAIAESIKTELGISAEVIPLGVDMALFRPVDRTDHGLPVKVVYVATIQPRKQTHLMLDLARRMRREPVEFHIIGPPLIDASYHARLLDEKERDGLKNVTFHGSMLHSELVHWLNKSDIYILPSRLEGFGKTTIEAAATGLPSIIFSDYKSTTVLNGVSGFQVGTFEQMYEKTLLLVRDRELRLRMGVAAAEHASQFNWDAIARRWETIFEEAAQRQ